MKLKILVVDDNHPVCQALQTLFSLQGYAVFLAQSPQEALKVLAQQDIDLVLQDMNFSPAEMHGVQGESLFFDIRETYPQIPIVLMTAWTQLETAVELVKAGATDYIAKPWNDSRLLLTVANALKLKHLAEEQRRNQQELSAAFAGKDLCGLVFASSQMRQLLQTALQLAPANASVLITGPNGAGKEGIANILHANSQRRDKPFVKVNMGALPTDLMEAELFGAEAGAYSGANKTRVGRFEAADGGTLFLDEIGNLPLEGQAKLLRVLQTGEYERLGSSVTRKVDVRLVSATNTNLTESIAQGLFRQDLYYRVNVVQLALPALSERPDDILPLARYFLAGKKELSAEAEERMLAYSWPGNVRELQNVCQRAYLLGVNNEVQLADLGLPNEERSGKRTLDDFGREELEKALKDSNGVISRAAKQLGISRQSLYRRMEYYKLAPP
ncbi:sigma-54-dependent Fis family transcriptional regulator [Aliidiomarina shirensis]|uniref:Sigma-54-dependent Fis family transcriptional regulator n=1 Tax=Aliidiomarina shirensis TaxID=1048642 RepID=A0A432WQD8_9GAMM|nr:sigma-54 dependent transcriptional regulator [Aliidiomarina shirensis]RUO35968.1 sigma-54-dependent Fis family transcriptional regulator [Aliidiomarina shirensis]